MPDIDRIIEQLLGDRRISEGTAFSSRTYTDQPIIERGRDLKARMERREQERAARRQKDAEERRRRAKARPHKPAPTQEGFSFERTLTHDLANTFAQLMHGPIPEPIRKMRALEGTAATPALAYGSRVGAELFYRQAQLMADYEDDYEFRGGFMQYYPTYAAMSDHQLRGYFSWRTRVRAGSVEPAPLSFAFVYVYELLCGIGTTPGLACYEQLRDFGIAYREADEYQGRSLDGYLRRWLRDYAIYHGIPEVLGGAQADQVGNAALTLLRAEHALLRQQGRTPRIASPVASEGTPVPEADALLEALGAAASYHLCDSRLAKQDRALVASVAADTFTALVLHCSKRRKTDFVEGLFGYATAEPYTMFSAAVFHEPHQHEDARVQVGSLDTFTCTNGHWRHERALGATARSSELGLILHAVDQQLRERLAYPYPLKQRDVPKYVQKIIAAAIDTRLAERAEAERRRITIDLSRLGSIRAAAALTQEALLTDEERDVEPASGQPDVPSAEVPFQAQPATSAFPGVEQPLPAQTPAPAPAEVPGAPADAGATDEPAAARAYGLTDLEARVLRGLFEGAPISQLLGPSDPFVSVVADTINEKLFDLVGDAVIEFEGDDPCLVEDYLQDIQEVLQP